MTPTADPIDVAAVLISASKQHVNRKPEWTLKARVIHVLSDRPKLSIEQEQWMSVLKLTGTVLNLKYGGPILPKLSIRSGILFRLSLPYEDVERALAMVLSEQMPVLEVSPEVIRPMAEPCVRVPLSILRELRGQEAGIEYSRQALVKTWSEDRRTGKARQPA